MKDVAPFLLNTGRTLAQMALYAPEHPSVKGAIVESHRLLTDLLLEEPELIVSSSEGKLLINGKPIENVPLGAIRPFLQLLDRFGLHSLSFLAGIGREEMIPFFRLASRAELKRAESDLAGYLASQNVRHIAVNQAKYAKISEDEVVGGRGQETGAVEDEAAFWQQTQDLSLSELLQKLIGRAVSDPNERSRLLQHALGLVKSEIEKTVERLTTEFQKEKVRLTNERERTEHVVETMADGVVVVDEQGNVLMMNPTAEKLYGVNLGECVGKPLWSGLREEQMISLAKDLTVPTDRPVVKEVELHGDVDTKKTLRASAATVQDPEGRVVGFISVLSDVTKQKELNRLQNEFMANVTHELRTPIHAVKLAIGAILEGTAGQVSQEQSKMLNLAGRNVDRLSRLIDDLLDFSKVEAGSMEIRPQMIDLGALLKEAAASLDSWAKSRGVVLQCQESFAFPQVFADSDRILQVVINLLSNAIKFTPAAGLVTLSASKTAVGQKEMVRVDVEDTGSGISQEDQRRIFDRFVQLERHAKNKIDVRGTGLGLSICQALIALHKGQLTVQSPPPGKPRGSLFSFTLPLYEGTKLPAGPTQEEAFAREERSSSKPRQRGFWKRILARFRAVVFISLLLSGSAWCRPHWGNVRRVLKPDVIQLKDGSKVRYIGVESPHQNSPYYVEAMAASKALVQGREIHLEYGLQERDLEGRWLAYVYTEGIMVNKELVKTGLFVVSGVANEEEHLGELLEAEQFAQKKRRGVWKDMEPEPYPVRQQRDTGFPWATMEEIKKGIKK